MAPSALFRFSLQPWEGGKLVEEQRQKYFGRARKLLPHSLVATCSPLASTNTIPI